MYLRLAHFPDQQENSPLMCFTSTKSFIQLIARLTCSVNSIYLSGIHRSFLSEINDIFLHPIQHLAAQNSTLNRVLLLLHLQWQFSLIPTNFFCFLVLSLYSKLQRNQIAYVIFKWFQGNQFELSLSNSIFVPHFFVTKYPYQKKRQMCSSLCSWKKAKTPVKLENAII